MKFQNLTAETSLTITDLVRLAGSEGLVMVPIINMDTKTLASVPCLASIVVGDEATQAQIREFIQPREDETILHVPAGWKMAHVMKALGCFPSVSAARKNGWPQDIPFGWSEFRIKHSKVRGTICLLNLNGPIF